MIKGDSNSDYTSFNSLIKHYGKVSKITNNAVTISLEDNISCAGCKAKAACGISESNRKEIKVVIKDHSYSINEPVSVIMQKHLGLKAVFWAYFFPFLLMFIVLVISSVFFEEWVAGLIAIFILFPYYLIIFEMKNLFQKKFKISILKSD